MGLTLPVEKYDPEVLKMTIETVNNEGNVTVKLNGRLDSTTAEGLEKTMESVFASPVESLTLDMGEVDYISSRGLRILVTAYKNMNGKGITLLSPNASIMEILRMSGLDKVFTVK